MGSPAPEAVSPPPPLNLLHHIFCICCSDAPNPTESAGSRRVMKLDEAANKGLGDAPEVSMVMCEPNPNMRPRLEISTMMSRLAGSP